MLLASAARCTSTRLTLTLQSSRSAVLLGSKLLTRAITHQASTAVRVYSTRDPKIPRKFVKERKTVTAHQAIDIITELFEDSAARVREELRVAPTTASTTPGLKISDIVALLDKKLSLVPESKRKAAGLPISRVYSPKLNIDDGSPEVALKIYTQAWRRERQLGEAGISNEESVEVRAAVRQIWAVFLERRDDPPNAKFWAHYFEIKRKSRSRVAKRKLAASPT